MKKEIIFYSLITLLLLIPMTSVLSYVEEDGDTTLCTDELVKPYKSEIESMDLGDLQFMWGVESQTSDFQSIGCGSNGTHFFVTGGNNGTDPNKVYIFDFDGNYIDSFDQSGTTGWGWLDLAWDGEYFYGGPEAGSRIDVFTEEGTIVDQISAPVPWCAGIAYDPSTDHLWTIDKWTDKILYEIDMDGNVIKSWSQDKNVYGLAWDDLSSGGPYIWVAVQDPQCTFYQFDPNVGDYTGVSFEAENPGSTDNKACGLGFTTDWNTSFGILFGIQQCDEIPVEGPGDQLAGYTVFDFSTPEPDLSCEGSLSWTDAGPGEECNGTFIVCNDGDDDSELFWEIISWPNWGNWTFDPLSSTLIAPDCITVIVTVIAPDEKDSEFTGEVKIVNKDNDSDFCIIDVYLSTPKNKPYIFNFPLLNWILEHFPNAFPILRYLVGL